MEGGGSSDFVSHLALRVVGFAKVGEGRGATCDLNCMAHGEISKCDRAFLEHADRDTVIIKTSPFECDFACLVDNRAQGEMGGSDGTSSLNLHRLVSVEVTRAA